MKSLFFLFTFFLLISCSSNNVVYWCGDHPCINKKEKEAYFKKNMVVEMKSAKKTDYKSNSEIESWIRETAITDYHPSGTCKMGNEPDSVVDEKLKVHGFENLYVVDASIMPDVVSGNLNAPTQMIAEKASDFLLGKKPLKPINAKFHFQNV